ncbi:MAG: phosphotransferase family protein [Actinomycetota bacterium]|jgi:aminoglycoside phosphotransferase (APT) family kinase protein|nr:phosphotransferase family protein [Actinomycetota bacterium]
MDSTEVGRLGAWFAANVAGSAPPLTAAALPWGRSNLTYRVTDSAGRAWALRRPPQGAVPGSPAHDLGREHRILVALAPTAVPAPAPVAFCDDESVIGAPFSVTEHVAGHVLREPADAEAALDEAGRRRAGQSFTDTLVAIHAVDVDAPGLADLGLGGGGGGGGDIASQLRRWYSEARAAQDITGRGVLLIEDMHRHLCANVPPDAGAAPLSLVHGDYRLDNVMVDDDGETVAVLDWETASLGDPLAELGLLLAYWTNPGEQNVALGGVAPTAAPGFPTRSEVAVRYAERSGRDLAHLHFYLAFAYWKLACILEGVYARQMAQAARANRDDRDTLAPFAAQVVRLAEAAREAAA